MNTNLTREVVIVGSSEPALMNLALAFRGTPYEITAAEQTRAIRAAMRFAMRHPAAMVVSLDGKENVAEIRELLSASPRTRFLFLLPQMPPRAALSRIVNTCGAVILSADESPIVVVATLIALLSGDAPPENGGMP
jgi:hypothetical protein